MLAEIEQELSESERELARLTERVIHLRKAAEGLRGLLREEDGRKEEDDRTPFILRPDEESAESIDLSRLAFRELPDSYDAVRMILKENADKPVHIDAVRAQFRERGWIPPDWSKPDAAIYAALVRAEKRDEHVVRIDRRNWSYRSRLDQSPDNESSAEAAAQQEAVAEPEDSRERS